MTGKFYAILVNAGDRTVPFEAVQSALGTDDWLRLNFNQFFVYTQSGAADVWRAVMPVLNPLDILFVSEIVIENAWSSTNPIINEWFGRARF